MGSPGRLRYGATAEHISIKTGIRNFNTQI